ncbi:MAG: hypothetical protein JWN52_2049 [Actinomycetia bacterium]|nr:hypothetical protein [Actinomycetes bacterium]
MNRRTSASLTTAAVALAAAAVAACAPQKSAGTAAPMAAAAAAPTAAATCKPLPFDMPTTSTLRSSKKKVFAYYFPPFPVSVDNKDPSTDQWATWLNPLGSNGQYKAIGGLVRDRPYYSRAKRTQSNWRQLDFEAEVRQAISQGLDGFIYEHHTSSDNRWNQLPAMLAAAKAVDPGFKIMLSPDFPTTAGASPDKLVSDILIAKGHPSLYRLADGSTPIAPFFPDRQTPAWWDTVRAKLAAKGMKTVLVPNFVYWPGTGKTEWNSHIYGYTTWGAHWVSGTDTFRKASVEAHARGRIFMSPVELEDVRPKDGRFWEGSNSGLLRSTWEKAIAGNADWVQYSTWNDYSESWTAPSKERGYAVGDVGAYYLTWFKTGKAPAIARDALYYFHRGQKTTATYDKTKQTAGPMKIAAGPAATDNVELLAFVKSAGKLVIKQGSDVRTKDVAKAGVVSFTVPMVPGTTPVFQLQRSGKTVQTITSRTPIRKSVTYQDMTYHAGGGVATCARS